MTSQFSVVCFSRQPITAMLSCCPSGELRNTRGGGYDRRLGTFYGGHLQERREGKARNLEARKLCCVALQVVRGVLVQGHRQASLQLGVRQGQHALDVVKWLAQSLRKASELKLSLCVVVEAAFDNMCNDITARGHGEWGSSCSVTVGVGYESQVAHIARNRKGGPIVDVPLPQEGPQCFRQCFRRDAGPQAV